MKEIKLTQEKVALIDDEDFEYVNQFKWYAKLKKGEHTYYAVRHERVKGVQITVSMHRFILKLKKGDGKIVDHKNRNGLDNQKLNLRLTTTAYNAHNIRKSDNRTSKYRGISFIKKKNHFYVSFRYNKKIIFCGTFKDEIEAAKAYDKKACELYGEYANLNFPSE